MPKSEGLYSKYHITKTDTGEEVEGAAFVLRPDRDDAAWWALHEYWLRTVDDLLRIDLEFWLHELRPDLADKSAYLLERQPIGHLDNTALDAWYHKLTTQLANALGNVTERLKKSNERYGATWYQNNIPASEPDEDAT